MADYEVIKSTKVFEGIIIDIVHDVISLPNGKTQTMEIATHSGASAIVPIDKHGNIILVKQYRHSIKDFTLEIPAGKLDKGEDPLTCATRELEEETGYTASNVKLLTAPYSAIGFCTEVIHLYVADVVLNGTLNLDEGEFVTVEVYTLTEARQMIVDGKIRDFKTIAGILMLDINK